jgi:hypothetical protein
MLSPSNSAFMPALALQTESSVEITKAALKVAWRWLARRSIWLVIRLTASLGSSVERCDSCRSTVPMSENRP